MLEIYCDATCEGWQNTQGKAKGKILILVPSKKRKQRIEEESEIENLELKQFINRFELLAIERADQIHKNKNKIIYSDSQIAVGWAKKRGINCEWIPREKNLAGHILENERIEIPHFCGM